jgi:hypothetical protein
MRLSPLGHDWVIVMCAMRFLDASRPLLPGLHAWLSSADAVRPADLIFVLAGQASRKHYALELFRQGLAPKLLFSVARFEIRRFSKMPLPVPLDLLALARDVPPPQRHFLILFQRREVQVTPILPRRFGTLTEIASLARWLENNPEIHSLLIISNEAHLRRIGICCRALLPPDREVVLLAVPRSISCSVEEQSSTTDSTRADLLEFLKVLLYRVLLTLRRRHHKAASSG